MICYKESRSRCRIVGFHKLSALISLHAVLNMMIQSHYSILKTIFEDSNNKTKNSHTIRNTFVNILKDCINLLLIATKFCIDKN